MADGTFKNDLRDLCDLTLVNGCATEDVEKVYEVYKNISEGEGALQSRFSRYLRLFPLGRSISAEVLQERRTLKEDECTHLSLNELKTKLQNLGTLDVKNSTELHEKPPSYTSASVQKLTECWAKWAVVKNKASHRCQASHGDELKELEVNMMKPYTMLMNAMSNKYENMISSLYNANQCALESVEAYNNANVLNTIVVSCKNVQTSTLPDDLEDLGVKRFTTDDQFKEMQAWIVKRRNHIKQIEACAPLLYDRNLKLEELALAEFVAHLESKDLVANVSETTKTAFEKYKKTVFESIANGIKCTYISTGSAERASFTRFGSFATKFLEVDSAAKATELIQAIAREEKNVGSTPDDLNTLVRIASVYIFKFRGSIALPAKECLTLIIPCIVDFCSKMVAMPPTSAVALRADPMLLLKDDPGYNNAEKLMTSRVDHCDVILKSAEAFKELIDNWGEEHDTEPSDSLLKKATLVQTEMVNQLAQVKEDTLAVLNDLFTQVASKFQAIMQCPSMATLYATFESLDTHSKVLSNDRRNDLNQHLMRSSSKVLYNDARIISEMGLGVIKKLKDAFGEEDCERAAPYIGNLSISRPCSFAASLTLLQSMWRELRPSDDRKSLVRKCVRALNPEHRGPLMTPFPCISQMVQKVDKGEIAESLVPTTAASEQAMPAAAPVAVVTLDVDGDAQMASRARPKHWSAGLGSFALFAVFGRGLQENKQNTINTTRSQHKNKENIVFKV